LRKINSEKPDLVKPELEAKQLPTEVSSIVMVSAIVSGAGRVSQEFTIRHYPQAPLAEIFWAALRVFKELGGLTKDCDDGIIFYPVHLLDSEVVFYMKSNNRTLEIEGPKQ